MTHNLVLGDKENKLLLTLEKYAVDVFTFKDAQKILQTSVPSVKNILVNLTRKRCIQRIERGKYLLVPARAGYEKYWSEYPWVIVPHLIDVYYVGFWTAMNFWGMTEQIPNTVFVATTQRKRSLEFGNQRFEFVALSEKKFFGYVEQKVGDKKFNISSKEKTLVDGLAHPQYCGGIPEVMKALWYSKDADDVNWGVVLQYAIDVGINVVLRRLGYLLSLLEIKSDIVNKIKKNTFKGYHYLDPAATKEKYGYSKDFGLIINRTEDDLKDWMEH
ncbi:MAG: type IV toxin-antitoxin system AbiEi family antitoxin domain-containing protein [Nitrosotalea sp.]